MTGDEPAERVRADGGHRTLDRSLSTSADVPETRVAFEQTVEFLR